MHLIESIVSAAPAIAAVRRDLHAHPELCFEETRTSDVVARQLTDWGIEVHRGLGKTGSWASSGTAIHPGPSVYAPTSTRCP